MINFSCYLPEGFLLLHLLLYHTPTVFYQIHVRGHTWPRVFFSVWVFKLRIRWWIKSDPNKLILISSDQRIWYQYSVFFYVQEWILSLILQFCAVLIFLDAVLGGWLNVVSCTHTQPLKHHFPQIILVSEAFVHMFFSKQVVWKRNWEWQPWSTAIYHQVVLLGSD